MPRVTPIFRGELEEEAQRRENHLRSVRAWVILASGPASLLVAAMPVGLLLLTLALGVLAGSLLQVFDGKVGFLAIAGVAFGFAFPAAADKLAPDLQHAWWQVIVVGASAIDAVFIAMSWWRARGSAKSAEADEHQ